VQDQRWHVYKRGVDFIQKYIFPGGMLPAPTILRDTIRKTGLEVTQSIEFGQSYSTTLRIWFESFNEKWDQVSAMGVDDRFRRMWNFYLASCAGAFRGGICDVTQITVTRPKT
jgi:cyclopropane-fatty-acyl-phospholipid synthase